MKTKKILNIYKQAQRFADITKALIVAGKVQRAKHCLQKAENLFNSGTQEVKNVISNVYLYSVSLFMEVNHFNMRELLPNNLQKEYFKQVNNSGI